MSHLPCHPLHPCLKSHPLCVLSLQQHTCISGGSYYLGPKQTRNKSNRRVNEYNISTLSGILDTKEKTEKVPEHLRGTHL